MVIIYVDMRLKEGGNFMGLSTLPETYISDYYVSKYQLSMSTLFSLPTLLYCRCQATAKSREHHVAYSKNRYQNKVRILRAISLQLQGAI